MRPVDATSLFKLSFGIFLTLDMLRPLTTKLTKMRAWQTRANVVGHVQLLDCDDKCWSDTTDGKWHPEWEEPEEGAKNNIADLSYLNDDRA